MFVRVCTCTFMHVYMCVYMYVCRCVYVCIRVCVKFSNGNEDESARPLTTMQAQEGPQSIIIIIIISLSKGKGSTKVLGLYKVPP